MATHEVPESILARLRKIRALAEQGIDGERTAAQHQLEKLLAEHGVTLEELTSETVREYAIGFRAKDEVNLFAQICGQVLDVSRPPVLHRRKARIAYVTCTAAQWADIKDRFAHYTRQLRKAKADLAKQARLLVPAMIQRHSMFPESASAEERKELTEEQRRELLELYRAMESLRTAHFQKPAPRLEHAQ